MRRGVERQDALELRQAQQHAAASGSAPPDKPVPAPRATTGTFARRTAAEFAHLLLVSAAHRHAPRGKPTDRRTEGLRSSCSNSTASAERILQLFYQLLLFIVSTPNPLHRNNSGEEFDDGSWRSAARIKQLPVRISRDKVFSLTPAVMPASTSGYRAHHSSVTLRPSSSTRAGCGSTATAASGNLGGAASSSDCVSARSRCRPAGAEVGDRHLDVGVQPAAVIGPCGSNSAGRQPLFSHLRVLASCWRGHQPVEYFQRQRHSPGWRPRYRRGVPLPLLVDAHLGQRRFVGRRVSLDRNLRRHAPIACIAAVTGLISSSNRRA